MVNFHLLSKTNSSFRVHHSQMSLPPNHHSLTHDSIRFNNKKNISPPPEVISASKPLKAVAFATSHNTWHRLPVSNINPWVDSARTCVVVESKSKNNNPMNYISQYIVILAPVEEQISLSSDQIVSFIVWTVREVKNARNFALIQVPFRAYGPTKLSLELLFFFVHSIRVFSLSIQLQFCPYRIVWILDWCVETNEKCTIRISAISNIP